MSVDSILAGLDPKLRKRLIIGSDIHIERLPVPSFGLNRALRGGLVFGRQVLIWGNKSAGKSSFCMQLIAEAQRRGKTAAWIDAEASFDPGWATALGMDTNNVIYDNAKSINDITDTVVQLMHAKVDIIVIDSISSALSSVFFEKDSADLKDLSDTKQIGADSRDMAQAVKMMNYANKNTLLILISQQRNKISAMFTQLAPTGGEATKFFSSTIIKLWSSESDNNAIKGQTYVGDKILEAKVGRKVDWHIDANKTGPAFIGGSYDFYFDGPSLGIDLVGEVFDMAEPLGVIKKSGAWYTVLGQQLQGRSKAIEWLRNNPDKLMELQAAL